MMNNGRPLSRKQTVRLMVGLTILAWATQTLLQQWGYGAEAPASEPAETFVQPQERFVPGSPRFAAGATLEMRAEATIVGSEVKLRQVCRWSKRDEAILEPLGDLVIARLGGRVPFKTITINEIRGILRDAGVNMAAVNFAGVTSCTVSRSDVEYDERTALEQWIEAKQPQEIEPQTVAANTAATVPSASPAPAASMPVAEAESPVKTLRELLIADLATRLNLPVESLQVNFRDQDQKTLNASTPLFKFEIEPVRAKSLGTVMWNVNIAADAGSKKATIIAEARAWQNQVVVARPLGFRQIIVADDIVERRALVEQLSDSPLLTKDQIIGQQAARELKPGTLFTARVIDPVELVKSGQFVTITLEQGSVRIKTVARALESGCYGQTIRVKNETTREIFQVVLTGPQTATMNLSASLASLKE